IAQFLRPKIIIIENVPQMMSHAHNGQGGGLAIQIRSLLQEMKYEALDGVLNAADFGVPQIRDRVFIVASRLGKPSLPAPTHAQSGEKEVFKSKLLPWVTVGEAISDLPPPPAGPADALGGGPVAQYANPVPSPFAKQMRSSKHFPYNHVTREYE